ncbi:MAG: hypothetical protein ACKO5E_05375, partial [bacterium]
GLPAWVRFLTTPTTEKIATVSFWPASACCLWEFFYDHFQRILTQLPLLFNHHHCTQFYFAFESRIAA